MHAKVNKSIKKRDLTNNVKLAGYSNNIYKYMLRSKAFILSSLWEDPGFVIIEAALCNSMIISSNCKNGPIEFLLNGRAGLLFNNNVEGELFRKLSEFKKLEKKQIFQKKVLAKKNSIKFTMFRHYTVLKNIIDQN